MGRPKKIGGSVIQVRVSEDEFQAIRALEIHFKITRAEAFRMFLPEQTWIIPLLEYLKIKAPESEKTPRLLMDSLLALCEADMIEIMRSDPDFPLHEFQIEAYQLGGAIKNLFVFFVYAKRGEGKIIFETRVVDGVKGYFVSSEILSPKKKPE